MEVAGLVLGSILVVLYALDNYKRCLDTTKDYWRSADTLSLIRMHVFIQQEQPDVTLRSIGLVKPMRADLEDRKKLYSQPRMRSS